MQRPKIKIHPPFEELLRHGFKKLQKFYLIHIFIKFLIHYEPVWDADIGKWVVECSIGECGMTSAVSERNGAQYIDVSVKIIRDIDEFQAMI